MLIKRARKRNKSRDLMKVSKETPAKMRNFSDRSSSGIATSNRAWIMDEVQCCVVPCRQRS
jgi:hypothetical protein